ncbi:MAG TPA: hypothetical protein VKA32_08975 [Gammaproteobacteria bacterium]|nr:hypothetical protein [Gammaproteobacteria bacterium]
MSEPTWQWIEFPAAEVARLLEHTESCAEHMPNPDIMLDKRYLKEGARPAGGRLPKLADVDLTRVPAGLNVVLKRGIWLASNGLPPPAPGEEAVCAAVCDPRTVSDWEAVKERLAGRNDQPLLLPAGDVRDVLAAAGEQVWLGLLRDEDGFGVEAFALSETPAAGD